MGLRRQLYGCRCVCCNANGGGSSAQGVADVMSFSQDNSLTFRSLAPCKLPSLPSGILQSALMFRTTSTMFLAPRWLAVTCAFAVPPQHFSHARSALAHPSLLRYYSAPLLHQYAVAFVRSIVNHVSVLQFPFFRCFFRLIYLICRPELSKCVLERQCRQVRILFIQRIHALVVTHLTAPNSLSAPAMAHTSTNTTTTRACPRIPSHYYPNLCASFANHSYHPHSFPLFSGGSDLRKLTAVYYLNPAWNNALGGLFRIYQSPPNHGQFTDIEPAADRLLVFWCVAFRSIFCAGL